MRAIAYAAMALLCSACATFGTLQTARPIEQGTFQLGIEPGMWHVKDAGAAPVTNFTARYGFGRRWDLGLRLGTAGVGVSGKFALTEPRTWALAVAPTVTTIPVGTKPLLGQLPLLVGLAVGPHELTIAPKLQGWSVRTAAGSHRRSVGVAAGVSLGSSLRIARGVRILPEVTFARPLFGTFETRAAFSDVKLRAGQPLYQVSFGVLLGGETNWWRKQYYPFPGYGTGP